MFKPARIRPTSRRLVAVVAAATVLAACGSDDRTDDQGPPCDCPEFIELIDTIDWAAGHGTTSEAAIYMAEPYQAYGELEPGRAHAIFAVHPSPHDPQVVAANIVQVLVDGGLEVSEAAQSGLKLSYEVTLADGEMTITAVAREGGGVGFWLRSVPEADALEPYARALGLIEHTTD